MTDNADSADGADTTSRVGAPTGATTGMIDRYFMVSARGSTFAREIRGGLATFFTMAYIVVLNPLIIGTVADGDGQLLGDVPVADPANIPPAATGISIPLVAAATALVAGVLTIAMGIAGRYPFALATGLGLNAFVAVGLASAAGAGLSWEQAMGLVVLEGVIIAVLVLTGLRTAVFHAIPVPLKTAISVGIGLFIAMIGFVDAGFVRRVPDAADTNVPVGLGVGGPLGGLSGWPLLVFVVGLLVTMLLVARRVRGAILIGIVGTTVLAIIVETIARVGPLNSTGPGGEPRINPTGWQLTVPGLPRADEIVATPDLGLVGQFSLVGGVARIGVVAVVLFVFTLMLADFFDTMGTVVGVGGQGGMLDRNGNLPGVGRVLLVDSAAAAAGGAASVSTNTTYVESAAGVGEGARTGLASLVTGALFLVSMFLAPLVKVVPFEAATPALVVVGFLMMTRIRMIDFTDYDTALPAFFAIVLMPFTFSITAGIGAAFVSYAVIKAARRRFDEVHPLMWIVSALFVLYFAIEPLKVLLGAD
jgi:AGZA family xanthine/uracil permease-like MFS transporter